MLKQIKFKDQRAVNYNFIFENFVWHFQPVSGKRFPIVAGTSYKQSQVSVCLDILVTVSSG